MNTGPVITGSPKRHKGPYQSIYAKSLSFSQEERKIAGIVNQTYMRLR